MRHYESLKRISVLWLSFAGLLIQTAIYAYIWMVYYYPLISKFTIRFKFTRNGHLLIFAIYLFLLFFFNNTYGGMKVGYLKPLDVFLSQVFSLLIVNVITYFQVSLMNNWLVPVKYFAAAVFAQLLIAGGWTFICNTFYRKVFPQKDAADSRGKRY